MDQDRVTFLREHLARAMRAHEEALAKPSYAAAVSALETAMRIRGELDKAIALQEYREAGIGNDLGALCDVVAELRVSAAADGSHVAAANLARVEFDMRTRLEADARAQAREQLSGMSDDDRARMISRALATLPDDLRSAVVAQVHREHGPVAL